MSHSLLNVSTKNNEIPAAIRWPAIKKAFFPLLMLCTIGVASIVIVIYFMSSGPAVAPPSTPVGPGRSAGAQPSSWVLAQSSLANLLSANRSVTTRTYDQPHVYISGPDWSRNPVPPGWRSVPTVNFKSYFAFAAAVRNAKMPGWTRAVLYDPEAWPQTPAHEQTHVAYYMKQFAQLAHHHNWAVIITPGTDLMNVYPKRPGETNAHAFVRFNIAGAAARYADISVTQSQTLELNPAKYRRFLLATRSQALAANPGDLFLGGLTVSVLGKPASAQALYNATTAVGNVVSGFFLFVSRSAPGPANAGQYLRALAAHGHAAPGTSQDSAGRSALDVVQPAEHSAGRPAA